MTTSGETPQLEGRPKSRDPLVGTILDGRFQIEDVLGSGGMSVVYKATQLRVNRHVAIKTLRVQLDTKAIYRERFQREISLLCALGHPHIVTVYDCLIGPDEQPYVVMDYLRGRSLEQLIKETGALSVERAVRIAVQVCSALEHAHRKGVIHRDLKPGNIVLMDDETDFVKVVDFGLAKLNHDNRKLTQSGELWGSPPYMSPEQAKGTPEDERSDIYSFGGVLFEMLTGKDPFHNAVSIFELIQAHVATPPPTMRSVDPATTVPAKLEQVVLKAMAKEPINRFQNATEMLNAIIDACSGMSEREAGELRLLSDSGKNRGSASQVSLPTVQSEATQPVEPGTPTAGASKVSAAELDSIPTPAKLPGPGLRQALSTPDPKTAWQSPKQQPTAPVDPGMRNRAIREFPSEQPKASNLLIAAAPIVLGIGLIAASLAVIVPHFMQTSHSQGAPISTPAQNAASGGEKATASDALECGRKN